ncbi:MAG: hypothetical protein AAGA64_17110 [Bacteroidota bacterium]
MKKVMVLLFLLALWLSGCDQKPVMEGLWLVKKVTVGNEDVTPNARWTRFNANHTYESGNGWFQHTLGTWQLDNEKNVLTMLNTNGIKDDQEPFTISISDLEMYWSREEEGLKVEVTLLRSNELPQTYGDQLLGLWQLKKVKGGGPYFNSDSIQESDYLFLRWDKRFVIRANNRRVNGVYNVHGHKAELELIPYNNELDRDFWSVDFGDDEIILTRLNSDSLITRTFSRIDAFP